MLETGIGFFSTDSYESRVYLNESDLPGAVSLTSLYGKGSRYYMLSRFTPLEGVILGAKVSGSVYDYQNEHFNTMVVSAQMDIRF
jgi:frataxin-like iron-binding protein CyaY